MYRTLSLEKKDHQVLFAYLYEGSSLVERKIKGRDKSTCALTYYSDSSWRRQMRTDITTDDARADRATNSGMNTTLLRLLVPTSYFHYLIRYVSMYHELMHNSKLLYKP